MRLTPPRDLAAITFGGDTVWLRRAAVLTGRAVDGSTADTLAFAPAEFRQADGVRDANLPLGLVVRLPRDPAAGVALRVRTRDTRPGALTFSVAVATVLLVFLYIGASVDNSRT